MSFRVGQKVVCVNADNSHSVPDIKELEFRAIYTIRAAVIFENVPCVFLEEILERPIFPFGWTDTIPFAAHRFVPVQERKTDISVFTAMLKPSKVSA